jgi:hypothetical protein
VQIPTFFDQTFNDFWVLHGFNDLNGFKGFNGSCDFSV